MKKVSLFCILTASIFARLESSQNERHSLEIREINLDHCKQESTETPGSCMVCDDGYGLRQQEKGSDMFTCEKCDSSNTVKNCLSCAQYYTYPWDEKEEPKFVTGCSLCKTGSYLSGNSTYWNGRKFSLECADCSLGGCLACTSSLNCTECEEGFTKSGNGQGFENFCQKSLGYKLQFIGAFLGSSVILLGFFYFILCSSKIGIIRLDYGTGLVPTEEEEVMAK